MPLPLSRNISNRVLLTIKGLNGALSITDIVPPVVTAQHFIETAIALSYDYTPDFNGPHQEGTGLHQLTVKNGKRRSAAAAFLVPITSVQDKSLK